jgi:acyl-coenzyme A thioesterase PaaI-like protein
MIDAAKKSFDRQGFMKTIGARLISVKKGIVKIECELHNGLTQQHGIFMQAL